MLTNTESTLARKILARKLPAYRKAYSDRTAWLMAYMSELAYLKFDKPDFDSDIVTRIVKRALEGTKKGSSEKILGIISKHCGYDHQAEKAKLKRSLEQVGLNLAETISVNATQAFVAYNDELTVLAFRGTEADRIGDIKADAKAKQTTCPTGGLVHSGFKGQYDDVEYEVEAVLDRLTVQGKPLFITGHSLGGAVASMATRRLNAERQIAACYTYGSPRVGTEDWVGRVKTPIYRIVNSADPVPIIPFSGTAIFWIAKALRALGQLAPSIGKLFLAVGNWLERSLSGYAHAGNMRFLTNCKGGDLSQANLLFTVGWSRRFRGALSGIIPWGKVLSDHSIAIYRRKLMYVANKRNP